MNTQDKKNIYIINGPNINLLGKREPHIYGHETLDDLKTLCVNAANEYNFNVLFYQSNREYEIIDWIHAARDNGSAIIINPAAFSHSSIAILDALKACECPIIEVHISNIHQREAFRHHSYISLAASGVIVGLGTQGYTLAIQRVARLLQST